jgi:ribonuclease HIII
VSDSKSTNLYTLKLSEAQLEKLQKYLDYHLWEYYEVEHARFAFKGDKVNIVGYKSGKLVIQGKKTEDFVTNILEPEITKDPRLGYDEVHHPDWFEPHAGMDESGKGDLFGPLVVATVIADSGMAEDWIQAGIKDSKTVGSDKRILALDQEIRKTRGVVVETAWASMRKYNELYAKFGNLNRMLGWLHARALETALDKKKVPWGLLDQFSKQPITRGFIKTHKDFDLRQQTKAESDPVVAAASIVARAQYVRAIQQLESNAGIAIPKGSGAEAKQAFRNLVQLKGPDCAPDFVKLHFKTASEVLVEF